MKNIDLKVIYAQLDEVGKFLRFRKKEIIKSIKISLKDFSNNFDTLEKKFTLQKNETLAVKDKLKETSTELNVVQNKYDLVSNFLKAESLENKALEEFKFLLTRDFMKFANNESALAEEAKAILALQDVEKRLETITSFPSIFNKNIVAVGGGFSAGKSEFINSFFIDNEIKLPVGINPVTAIPTYITVGNENLIKGYSYKGGMIELSSTLYKQLSHDFIKSLGFNLKDIAPIMAIETPMDSYENICFIDTPGYNPSNTGYTDRDSDTSKEYLEHANTLLWTIGIDTNGTIPASDLEFLENIALDDKKIYIIANKADLRSADDIEDILDVFEEILDEYDIEYEGISAFSSINQEELNYRKMSLFEFLEQINNPVEVEKSIVSELNSVFEMYKNAINEQIDWTKGIQSHFNSLELDLLEISIDESDKARECKNNCVNPKIKFI
jgi:GTP-binding protein EngB required for normal cell division